MEVFPASTPEPPMILKLVAHTVRWKLLRLLARSDYHVQDLASMLHLPQNLVSYHLRQLRNGHIVSERRSAADERFIYYSMDIERLRAFYQFAGTALHPGVTSDILPETEVNTELPTPSLRVLFLCRENSARSQMAEALLRHLSHGHIAVSSAGSHPAKHIHPLAIQTMMVGGLDIRHQHPKDVDTYRGEHFDYIVTVCDRLHESCPVFPGDPVQIHWSFADPALVEGAEDVRTRAFEQTSLQLTMRIRFLLILLQQKKGYQS